jgi:hypothetical protein
MKTMNLLYVNGKQSYQAYLCLTATIPAITHRPILYLKHDVSETWFCLRLQTEPTKMDPTERASLSLSLSGL